MKAKKRLKKVARCALTAILCVLMALCGTASVFANEAQTELSNQWGGGGLYELEPQTLTVLEDPWHEFEDFEGFEALESDPAEQAGDSLTTLDAASIAEPAEAETVLLGGASPAVTNESELRNAIADSADYADITIGADISLSDPLVLPVDRAIRFISNQPGIERTITASTGKRHIVVGDGFGAGTETQLTFSSVTLDGGSAGGGIVYMETSNQEQPAGKAWGNVSAFTLIIRDANIKNCYVASNDPYYITMWYNHDYTNANKTPVGAVGSTGNIKIYGCTLEGNSVDYGNFGSGSTGSAGGAASAKGTLDVYTSTVSGNKAYYGGGLYSQGNMVIHTSTISNNEATRSAAFALENAASNVRITNSIITYNKATDWGGIYISQDTLNSNDDGANLLFEGDNTVSYNESSGQYGTIFTSEVTISDKITAIGNINHGAAQGNISTLGGFISTWRLTMTITEDSIFEGNLARNDGNLANACFGGAIFATGPCEIKAQEGTLTFKDNKALKGNAGVSGGGAIYNTTLYSSANPNTVSQISTSGNGQVVFEGNAAAYGGACVFRQNPQMALVYGSVLFKNNGETISSSTVARDTSGGAIWSAAALRIGYYRDGNQIKPLQSNNVVFENNEAKTSGGAIYSEYTFRAIVTSFDGNEALYGGAIAATTNTNTLVNYVDYSIFTGNRATGESLPTGSGGAIWVPRYASLRVADSSFSGNTAPTMYLGGLDLAWDIDNVDGSDKTTYEGDPTTTPNPTPPRISNVTLDSSYPATATAYNNADICYIMPTAASYRIFYELDSGTNNASNPSVYTAADLPRIIQQPTKQGYSFDGWTATGGLPQSTPTPTLTIPAGTTGNITLVAHWTLGYTPQSFYVTYHSSGHNSGNVPARHTHVAGDTHTVQSHGTLERSGYTFRGWDTSAAGQTVVYTAGATIPNIVGHHNLYAVWQENTGGTPYTPPTPQTPQTPQTPPATITPVPTPASPPAANTSTQPAPPTPKPAATQEPAKPSTETVVQPETPQDDISESEVPRALPLLMLDSPFRGSWSLLSLIMSVAGVLIALLVGVIKSRRSKDAESAGAPHEHDEGKTKGGRGAALRIASIALGILAPVVWLIFDDLTKPVVLINEWTILVALIFVANLACAIVYCRPQSTRQTSKEAAAQQTEGLTG